MVRRECVRVSAVGVLPYLDSDRLERTARLQQVWL